jgi:hypothetical protein
MGARRLRHAQFADVGAACVTLFALLNGDVVHDVIDDIYPVRHARTHSVLMAHRCAYLTCPLWAERPQVAPFISRVYLFTFICLFIYAVLNIFIAIIEDAFFASKAVRALPPARPPAWLCGATRVAAWLAREREREGRERERCCADLRRGAAHSSKTSSARCWKRSAAWRSWTRSRWSTWSCCPTVRTSLCLSLLVAPPRPAPPRLTVMRAAVVAAQADGAQPQVGPTEHQLAE